MLNYQRYKRVPVVNFPERTWPDKEIQKAPVWCSVAFGMAIRRWWSPWLWRRRWRCSTSW